MSFNPVVVIGVDPDSEAHGVAIFRHGELEDLKVMPLMDLLMLAKFEARDSIDRCKVSIENVMINKFIYARNQHSSKAAQSKIAMSIGRCQQAQVELERALKSIGVPFELHRPTKNNWANNKPMFEKVTGWNKRSNVDTRSAAYFGFLASKEK